MAHLLLKDTISITGDDTDCVLDINESLLNYKTDEIKIDNCTETANPFFVSLTRKQTKITKYNTYEYAIIMCMRDEYNNEEEASKIYNKTISIDEMREISKYFTLIKCPKKVIYSDKAYNNILIIDRDILELFNNKRLLLDSNELVLPMFELKENIAEIYTKLYDNGMTLGYITKMIKINSYYNSDYAIRAQKHIYQLLSSLNETEFWTNTYTCKLLTMTEQFMARSFQLKCMLDDKKKKNIVLKMEKDCGNIMDNITKGQKNAAYYISNIMYKKDDYFDLAKALEKHGRKPYYATQDGKLNISKNDITELFRILKTDKEKYDLFNSLLITKEYCHLVLNNMEVLIILDKIITKFMPLYKYIIGYAWLCFYTEECLAGTRTINTNRYVFDIETANKLPVFPYPQNDIYQNPYVTHLVSEKANDIMNNCMSMGINNDTIMGIDTLDNFKWKFNLFTSGKTDIDIFKDLDWGETFAVSGSIIPACITKRPPLFDLIVDKSECETKKFLTYLNQYYGDSDIDLMCNDKSVFDFIDKIVLLKNILCKNLNESTMEITPIKSTTIIITEYFLREKMTDIGEYVGNTDITIEEIMVGLMSNQIKEYFYGLYIDAKRVNNKQQRQKHNNKECSTSITLYDDYYKIMTIDDIRIVIADYDISKEKYTEKDCETCIYMNDIYDDSRKVPEDKNMIILKISENIKFKLKSPKMPRCIEAFRAKSKDFFAVVSRFHLPCVRGYYNGKTVYMLPSCITANMTFINIDYKYFAGVRDPIQILNKYRTRGFSILLNSSEKQHMMSYIKHTPEMSKMFYITPNKDKNSMNKLIFGYKDINDYIYKIKYHTNDYPLELYNKIITQQIKTIYDLQKIYNVLYKYDADKMGLSMFNFKTINSNGTVNPLQKWVIDACWHMLNQ